MASFTLLVTQSPLGSCAHLQALDFAQAVLNAGHQIERVFFYQDAVYVGLNGQTPIQGQKSLAAQWLELARLHAFPLELCIANALRRGIADAKEQARHTLPSATLVEGFVLSGLGALASACKESDRVVQF